MIFIKKYPNRKLYFQHQGNIALEDILKYVSEGKEFRVVNAQTGQDLTVETLGAALLKTLSDLDCDAFDLIVTAIRVKKTWKLPTEV